MTRPLSSAEEQAITRALTDYETRQRHDGNTLRADEAQAALNIIHWIRVDG